MTAPKIDPETVARYLAYTVIWTSDGVVPVPDPCGDWVRSSDYQALAARVAELLDAHDTMGNLWAKGAAERQVALGRAEAAEAKLAAKEAEAEKLRKVLQAIAETPNYPSASWMQDIARAALQETER